MKETPKVAYSVALVLAFLSAENENRQLEDLPRADFGRLPLLQQVQLFSLFKSLHFGFLCLQQKYIIKQEGKLQRDKN